MSGYTSGANHDPEPWRHVDGARASSPWAEGAPMGGYTYDPRPEYENPLTEPEVECQCSDSFTASLTGHGHACPLYDQED